MTSNRVCIVAGVGPGIGVAVALLALAPSPRLHGQSKANWHSKIVFHGK